MPIQQLPECNLAGGCRAPDRACIDAGRCTAFVPPVEELRGQTADVAHALTELRKASSAGLHGSITWIALAIVTAAALVSC